MRFQLLTEKTCILKWFILWRDNILFNSGINWYMLWRGYAHKKSFFWSQLHALHHSWPHMNVICVCTLKQNKGGVDKEIFLPHPACQNLVSYPQLVLKSSDSSNNSLPLRLKHWQTQLILVNVYLSFVCIIHTYIYIYRRTHTYVYIYIYLSLYWYTYCVYTHL